MPARCKLIVRSIQILQQSFENQSWSLAFTSARLLEKLLRAFVKFLGSLTLSHLSNFQIININIGQLANSIAVYYGSVIKNEIYN